MKRISTDELADTQNAEDFRSRLLLTSEANRSRLIEKSEKLTKSVIARLLKNINCKEILDTKVFDAEQIIDVAKSQLICMRY